jgi:uncharacterized protein with NRDE domain
MRIEPMLWFTIDTWRLHSVPDPMCLIAIAYKAHPKIRLLVLANRDEFHQRPTESCQWWNADEPVLSGRDLQAGGTWMAINQQGRFAAVTNYREAPAAEGQKSRGQLPLEFLASPHSAVDFGSTQASRFNAYAGFNLLLFDGNSLAWVSNRNNEAQQLDQGVHGLSNRELNSDWPKVRAIRSALAESLTAEPGIEDCLDILGNRSPGKDSELPDTGVGLELERLLSPGFIVSENYGTRSSTVLMIREDASVQMTEVSFDSAGNPCARQDFAYVSGSRTAAT